jgi:hypothetical protein
MQENDARRLDHHTLEALRERAVRKVQEGESPEVVARVLGLNRSTTRMRRALAPFSKLESSNHTQSSADFITNTSGFSFRYDAHLGHSRCNCERFCRNGWQWPENLSTGRRFAR